MKESDFSFDLQLFNDGEGGNTGETTGDQTESGTADNHTDLPSNGVGIKDGQLYFIEDQDHEEGGDEEGDGSDDNGQAEVDSGVEQPQTQQPAQAQEGAQVQPSQQQPILQQSQEQAPKQQQQVDIDEQIANYAMQLVSTDLGQSGQEFDPFDPKHQAKYAMTVSRLEREVNEYVVNQQKQKVETQKVYEEFSTSLQAVQEQDKENFAGIDILAKDHWQNMPFAKAKPISDAIERMNAGNPTSKDVETLKDYWEVCRSEFYAKKTGIGRTPKEIPPSTERPGQGDTIEKEVFDAKKLGNMTQEQRINFYKQSGFADKLLNI